MPHEGVNPGALELIPEGFAVLAFPASLQADIRQSIADRIQSGDDLSQMTDTVCALSDAQFIEKFNKGFRTFPDSLSTKLTPWIEKEIRDRLHANQVSLTYVSEADRKTNASLGSDSYDVYWRIVRPNKPDVGGPHNDAAFADLNIDSDRAIPLPFKFAARWRVWLPLMGCTPRNSLQFIPGSQNEHFPATSRDTPLGPRPSVSEEWQLANDHRFVCPFTEFEGQCVLFSDKVIHRGPINTEDELRISADFTIVMR